MYCKRREPIEITWPLIGLRTEKNDRDCLVRGGRATGIDEFISKLKTKVITIIYTSRITP